MFSISVLYSKIFQLIDKVVDIITEDIKHKIEKKKYLAYVVNKFEYADFPSKRFRGFIPELLREDIYINTRVKEYFLGLPPQSRGNGHIDGDFVDVFNALYNRAQIRKRPLKLAILGPAGSGKTTLMKWLALQCASKEKNIFSGFIPVYFDLEDPEKDLAEFFRENSLVDLVQKELEKKGLKSSFIKAEFDNGRVLFLFDGLNRRLDGKCRQLNRWIQNQALGQNVLLTGTRKTGSDDFCIPDFGPAVTLLAIQDFNIEDIKNFLEKWFYSVETKIASAVGQKYLKLAEKEARGKYRYLVNMIEDKNNSIFQLMAVKPLCLTTMAIVFLDLGKLPTKLPDLCQESFRVILKLTGNANFPANKTSVKKVMECLAKIAVLFLIKNRQEMSFSEIQDSLNEDQLSFLLDEIVLKTGLLYKVQDSYSFTHITFQEYLAAWHFGKAIDYTPLLEFRNEDNWIEVFTLFVNMAEENVTRQFFTEIIQGLVGKKYWPQMLVWTNCLLNIADEKIQNDVEIQFAREVFRILSGVKYNKSTNEDDERLVIYLYIPYPQFKHAMQFKNEAWELFNHADHPLVQTFGSSILHDICRKDPDEALKFITALKDRIDELEKQDELEQDKLFDFLYRNHNSISLIIALRRNLPDFTYALEKLKSPHPFIKYLFLVNFCNLLDILDTFKLIVLPELKELLRFLDAQWFFKGLNPLFNLDFWAARDFMTFQGFVELQTSMNLAAVLTPPSKDVIPDALRKYETEFREKLRDTQFTIEIKQWVKRTYHRLSALPDKKLLAFFPGTTKAEIDQFRTDCKKLIDLERN